MTGETFSAIVGGLVGAVVGAVSTALVSGHQKRADDNERMTVLAGLLAREIGYAVTNLIDAKTRDPGSIKLADEDFTLKWCSRISEWATLFSPSTVSLVSDFSTLVADTVRVHRKLTGGAWVYSRGAENWKPFVATLKRAIDTGIAAHDTLARLSKPVVKTPPLGDDVLSAFRAAQIAQLTEEQQ